MRKPSRLFVRVEPGKSHTNSIDSGHIQSTTAFKSSAVGAREFGKAVLFLTTFIICGLVPLSASAVEPVPPQGVSASDGSYLDIIRVTWADVTDETSYEVFRCDTAIASSCGSAAILPADTIQFDDISDEIIGGNYYYRVKSCIVDTCSEFSATDSGYTQLAFESSFEVDSIAITDFDINGQSSVTLQPGDAATLDWSTSNAQDCVASSLPNLDAWNQAVSISTYGPKTISLSEETVADTYFLDLSCMSTLDMEAGKYVTLFVTTEPDAPFLESVIGGDGSAVLLFTATSDGGSAITAYTANCEEFSSTGESSPIEVNNLSNGTEYSCWVIARNANGDSPKSNVVTVTPVDPVVITDFQLTTNKGTQPISCGDVVVTLNWAALNESTCYGSWRESEANPDGDLTNFPSPDTVLVEDLALDEAFTLRCENSQGSVEAERPLSVKAPCLPTLIKLWNEVFPSEWPFPPSYQVIKAIPEPAVYAIMFNTSDISTAGAVGTIEYSSTRGLRLVAISTKPGDFQVADECRQYQFIDGNVIWETEGSNQFPDACRLQPDTDYYWNTTFSDGINSDSGTCTGTPCITYMKTVTVYR